MSKPAIQLGLRANWARFSLLVLVNAFVGAMVDALADRASDLSRDAVLGTACGTGSGLSERGAARLRALGFASVPSSLCGGTQAWLGQRPPSTQGAP